MESWLVVFLVTIGYLALSLAVGLFSGRKASSSTEGYVAGDRNLGFLVLYFILGASIYSAFAFLGGPGWAYSRGAAAFYIIAYGTIGLLPWYFLGPRIARLGRQRGYVIQAELFADRYQSSFISAILALISLVAFVPYLILQMQGAGYVFSVVTEGRIPMWGGAAIAYGVVMIYVFKSGVMGVAWTNTFQGILMLTLAWVLGLYLPYKLHGGVGPMFEELARVAPDMLRAPGLDATGNPWTWGGYSSSIAISVLGFSVWPHYFMKIYTARDVRSLKRMIVFYPTFQIFLIPIMFIGFAGVTAFPGVTPADTILPTIVTSMGLPAVVVGFFCAGALAASMSSGDAIVHAAGSVMVKDFYGVMRSRKLDGHDETRLIRLSVVVVIGALATTSRCCRASLSCTYCCCPTGSSRKFSPRSSRPSIGSAPRPKGSLPVSSSDAASWCSGTSCHRSSGRTLTPVSGELPRISSPSWSYPCLQHRWIPSTCERFHTTRRPSETIQTGSIACEIPRIIQRKVFKAGVLNRDWDCFHLLQSNKHHSQARQECTEAASSRPLSVENKSLALCW